MVVLPRRWSAFLALKIVLNALVGLEADQTLMLAFTDRHVPFGGLDISGVDDLLEQARDRHRAQRAVLTVFGEVWIALQKALHFGLAGKASGGIALQGFPNDGCKRLIGNKHFATAALGRNVFVSGRRAKNPKSGFHPCFHLLDHLAAILFALKMTLRGHDRFNEFAFRRIFKIKVQAFWYRSARGKLPAQLPVKVAVARKAFQIIENDDVRLCGLRIEIAEKRNHAGALHEIAAARHIVREHRLDSIAVAGRIGAAALLLRVQSAAVQPLLG